ncbi:hypothetical protein N7499_006351 [Penicillium canescens]|nr:hypothetical protein N7499_006351 [Penicillium canescens]KAJ6176726.1 hypothetical protein N7485_003640 [Penicillium canescens]
MIVITTKFCFILRWQESINVMGLLRPARHRPMVLMEGEVMVAAADIAGNRCRVRTLRGLAVAEIFERLGI